MALCLGIVSVAADEKMGMPDLAQVDQTCLPTSTANLIIWFGHHGYPKLIMDGATEDERELRTVHRIMADTDADFDFGTNRDKVPSGIEKFIHDAGYACDVEYRGLWCKGSSFSPDWLKENDDPNKGFILLLNYCHSNPQSQTYDNAYNAGHAVTLVNAESDLLLIHDPAHEDDETGRKIVTPYPLTSGLWRDSREQTSVAGLMLLSGSLLEGPPDSEVMVTGAVCITMHPSNEGKGSSAPSTLAPGAGNVAGAAGGAPTTVLTAPLSSGGNTSWWGWLVGRIFSK